MFKVFKPLFFEQGNMSLGRVSFWLVMGLSFYLWIVNGDIPSTLLQVNFALLGYNLFKKDTTFLTSIFSKVQSVVSTPKPEQKKETEKSGMA